MLVTYPVSLQFFFLPHYSLLVFAIMADQQRQPFTPLNPAHPRGAQIEYDQAGTPFIRDINGHPVAYRGSFPGIPSVINPASVSADLHSYKFRTDILL